MQRANRRSVRKASGVSTVRVNGLKPSIGEALIHMYFSSIAQGPVKRVERIVNGKTALVHFVNHTDAESVANKAGHVLDGKKLQVSLYDATQTDGQPRHTDAEDSTQSSAQRGLVQTKGWTEGSEHTDITAAGPSAYRGPKGTYRGPKDTYRGPKDSPSGKKSGRTSAMLEQPPQSPRPAVPKPRQTKRTLATEMESGTSEGEGRESSPNVHESPGDDPRFEEPRGDGWVREQPPATSTASPQPRQTKITLGKEMVERVTQDPSMLRMLTATLKPVEGKFQWKRPDSLIVKCVKDDLPQDWEASVEKLVENFVSHVQIVSGYGNTLTDSKESETKSEGGSKDRGQASISGKSLSLCQSHLDGTSYERPEAVSPLKQPNSNRQRAASRNDSNLADPQESQTKANPERQTTSQASTINPHPSTSTSHHDSTGHDKLRRGSSFKTQSKHTVSKSDSDLTPQKSLTKRKRESGTMGQADVSEAGPSTKRSRYDKPSDKPKGDSSPLPLKQPQSMTDAAPPSRETKINLGKEVIDRITQDREVLRKLSTALKCVEGKFQWKRPESILVKCLKEQVPTGWEHSVEQVIEAVVSPIKRH